MAVAGPFGYLDGSLATRSLTAVLKVETESRCLEAEGLHAFICGVSSLAGQRWRMKVARECCWIVPGINPSHSVLYRASAKRHEPVLSGVPGGAARRA